jgi:hypothetical protein
VTTILQLPHAVVDVHPGDQDAATTVEAWLQDYATSRDPQLRERIILAYLGVADRLARRFRDSRGTSAEDLVQTARAGVIAPSTATTPATAPRSSPTPWPVWSANSNATCAIPAGGSILPGRSRNHPCGCAGQPP